MRVVALVAPSVEEQVSNQSAQEKLDSHCSASDISGVSDIGSGYHDDKSITFTDSSRALNDAAKSQQQLVTESAVAEAENGAVRQRGSDTFDSEDDRESLKQR